MSVIILYFLMVLGLFWVVFIRFWVAFGGSNGLFVVTPSLAEDVLKKKHPVFRRFEDDSFGFFLGALSSENLLVLFKFFFWGGPY